MSRIGPAPRASAARASRRVSGVHQVNAGVDRRIDDLGVVLAQPERRGALSEPLAVEGDLSGRVVGAGEEIERPAPVVVPDFGAVQRQHGRLAVAPRQPRADLREQAVAVQVNQVGVADRRRGAPCYQGGLPDAAPLPRAPRCRGAVAPRNQRHRTRKVSGAGRPRRVRHVRRGVALRACAPTELDRQQRVGGLIGRQVGSDVADSHGWRRRAARQGDCIVQP